MMRQFSVSEINAHIKSVISDDFALRNICIKGEVSNCKYHDNGHIYFTLKDKSSAIRAVIWKTVPKPAFKLEDGMEILVQGQVSVYEAGGYYQVNVREVSRQGLGELYLKLDMLKKQFAQMGYFAPQYKKQIPRFSSRIGVVTAKTGAAIRDIYHIATDRNPYAEIILYNALVQGKGAAESIVRGIQYLDTLGLDVIIIGRGGGSIEDLWAFNEEIVAEAVFCADTPIVSAVGHETDDTLTDLIADRRAATPSDAARISVCELALVLEGLEAYKKTLASFTLKKTSDLRALTKAYSLRLSNASPKNRLDMNKQRLRQIAERLKSAVIASVQTGRYKTEAMSLRLGNAMTGRLNAEKHRLEKYAGKLEILSPLKSLSRGYGYVENDAGKRISGVNETNTGDHIKIYFTDGYVRALVEEKGDVTE